MYKIFIRILVITIVVLHLDCEVYFNRPKIKTDNGHLILEPGVGKNIYLRRNGPQSTIYVGEINILKLNISETDTDNQHNDEYNADKNYRGIPSDIIRRLERLESHQSESFNVGIAGNLSLIWRKVNRLTTTVNSLRRRLTSSLTTNNCQSHPCQNGGTCLNLVNDYFCLCSKNWEGKSCDLDVNECRHFAGTDLGCQNGATCINWPGSYECVCRSGWFGLHCTRKAKDCSGGDFEMCGHGTCVSVSTGEGIKCICDQGWTTNGTGVTCLTDVNECESKQGPRCSINPKVDCINLPGSFKCGSCPTGYEGDGYICSDIDECLLMSNGGCSTNPIVQCHNTVGSYFCGPCPPDFIGDGVTCTWQGSCRIFNGGCHPSAQCIERIRFAGKSHCLCPEGMDGDGVGPNGCYVTANGNASKNCQDNPCVHGRCRTLVSGYTCICEKGYGGAYCNTTINYCLSNPCLNGGICKSDESTLQGYRCECTAQFSGLTCQIPIKTCGGVLDAEEGSIVYPLNNNSYNHNSKCAWVIHTSLDKVVKVTFTKFDIEMNPECSYDFLQIHDGRNSASQLIGRFCGTEFPKGGTIISSHNNMYFWFRSDQTIAKSGFTLHWTSIKPFCGGKVDVNNHGHISSPGSPGNYPPNRDCFWHLSTIFGKRIQLHFFELDIEAHNNCSFDYLAIYDGEHVTDPLISKYCNSSQPPPITSAGSDILIHFHSDDIGSGKGFQISYATVEGVPGCGGYYTGNNGEITSPSFNSKYLANLLCEYKIKTQLGTRIRLEFVYFHLELSFRCKYDYLKIYDGPSADSRLVGRFCGTTYPSSYVSSSNSLFIKFKSDRSVTQEGFKIKYDTICQQIVAGDSGIVKSPGYPFNYTENRVCEYIIQTVPGKAIQLTFQDFDIEDNKYFDCLYDNVEIRDGPDVNSTLMGRYCGSELPPVQTSTHNYMYIRFNSDMSVSGAGFYANYTTVNSNCGGIHKEPTGLINYPLGSSLNYDKYQNCTWLLIAPVGNNIKVSWNRFDIESSPSCHADYLELTEIDESNNPYVLPKFCGNSIPPTLTISTNRLRITFHSDGSVQSSGFSMSYTFLEENSHCGGSFIKTHGVITTPGWPDKYQPNRNCVWTITVPFGQKVKLNISQFDLERPIREKCDYGDFLELRNGGSESAPLIGKFCGTRIPKVVVSMGNSLYLRFHTDFYLSGNGFRIEWDGSLYGCGGTITTSSGSLSSPNYPFNYQENAECFYKIITNHGSRIQITFIDLDMERSQNCKDDYVELFDGRDHNAESIGRYCSISDKTNNIQTSTNYAFVKFRSDFMNSGKGFLLNYVTICKNNISGSYGVIESPDYPNLYAMNLDCKWIINVPVGNKINVTFTHFNVFNSYPPRIFNHFHTIYPNKRYLNNTVSLGCVQDYVKIKELQSNFNIKKICGSQMPAKITTQSNSLEISFVTSSFTSGTGFRLEWVRYGCGGHIKRDYGFINLDKSQISSQPIECEWIIETNPGASVSITFTELYMEVSPNCSIDAIEIYAGQNIRTPLISKFCSKRTSTIRSPTNLLLVRFTKRSYLRDVNFSSYFVTGKSDCGGHINALFGTVMSLNYPKNYDNNLDCVWFLSVPVNHRIEFNIIELDLYNSEENENNDALCGDYIAVYDGEVSTSNYTKIICPSSVLSPFTSKSNILGIQFITDGYGTAKGFKANFTATCGASILVKNEGILTTEDYVTQLNKNCSWTIVAPKLDQKISLTLTYLSLPRYNNISTNRHCPSSFLRIFDGIDLDAPLIDEFCGRKIPPTIVSHGNAITVLFGSYLGLLSGKFVAHYTTVDEACGGTLMSEEGSIASPNYPISYPVNADCEWILSTSVGNRVYITFENFDLGYSEGCNEDYLEIRENNGGGRILGVYCGKDIPLNTTVASKIYIKFHSDNKEPSKGFLLHYGFLHGNEFKDLNSGEIASPLYPQPYEGSGEYTWRITTTGAEPILLTVSKLEIKIHASNCYNSLSIYDGYDDEAPLLKELCGLAEAIDLRTSTNIVFIKLKLDESNSGAIFFIRWSKLDTSLEKSDLEKITCGSNGTETISAGKSITIKSPNYPANYDNNEHCVWVFKPTPGRHLTLQFHGISLEEQPHCFADYIEVYNSNTGVSHWKQIDEKICLPSKVGQLLFAFSYLKVEFVSDASFTYKGFLAEVKSACGGLVTSRSGMITPTWFDWHAVIGPKIKCEWTVKVRPGRTIVLHFEHFNITNRNNNCDNSVVIRNGDSTEAPLLGNMMYCGLSNEQRDNIETSSNSFFLVYTARTIVFQNFRLRYEEKNVMCGSTSNLDANHNWEVITSPNYPFVPTPYSECIWSFNAPLGEILRIDFIDRFDLKTGNDCPEESIDIYDGSSNMSPLIGKYCEERPGSVKTSGNTVYIKYITQVLEPRNGFKANISIDTCGGLIVLNRGEITSPGYPRLHNLPIGSVCEWRLTGFTGHVFLIKPQVMDLPDSESKCGTKVTIEEKLKFNNTVNILKTFCNDEESNEGLTAVETTTNEVSIKLFIGKPSEWRPISEFKGFRITFNSSRPLCGGSITTPEGFIATPEYPRHTSLRYCQWLITAPSESRRIRLEIQDASIDAKKHIIGIFNDLQFQSPILNTSENNVYESSGNKLAIYVWLTPLSREHRFKAKFSSHDPALCGGTLTGRDGQLASPLLERSYSCDWHYIDESRDTLTYNTFVLNASVQSSKSKMHCGYHDPKLIIKYNFDRGVHFRRDICRSVDVSYVLPVTKIDLKAIKNTETFNFHVSWKLQPCGGVIDVGENPINIIKLPDNYNGSLDCAWILRPPYNDRIEITLEGSFKLDCANEFLRISRQSFLEEPIIIKEFCREKSSERTISMQLSLINIRFHTQNNKNDIKLTAQTTNNQCGGTITKYTNVFMSPNYPKSYKENQECVWTIHADVGTRISLKFVDRFVIEQRLNCTKDSVIIYDWDNDSYIPVAKLCGREMPPVYNSTGQKMKVVLRTDDNINLDGFKAVWTPICGGLLRASDKEQLLYSPNYPNEYIQNANCDYQIVAPEGRKILIKFLDFELEGPYPNCDYDNLTIQGLSSSVEYDSELLCGNKSPEPKIFEDQVKLIFKSDRYLQKKGFKILYQLYSCAGEIKEPTVLTSNQGQLEYENNMNCSWYIEAPANKIVVLKFLYIDLEDNKDCYADYLAVYNGFQLNENKRIALLCGHVNSTTVLRSTGNKLLLLFITDFTLNYKGFKVEIFFSYDSSVGCGGLIQLKPSSTHTLKSPLLGNKLSYENYLDCHWTITAPTDLAIEIEFKSFHVAPCVNVNQTALGYSQCNCDLVEIRDGPNPNSLLIGTYCGHTIPPKLTSSGNLLGIRLYTDGEISSSGFEALLKSRVSACGRTSYHISNTVQRIKTSYVNGAIPRGEHCLFTFYSDTNRYYTSHIRINTIDLQDGSHDKNICNRDKVVILTLPSSHNNTIGQDFKLASNGDFYSSVIPIYKVELQMPQQFEFCGKKESIDLYVDGDFQVSVQTSTESDSNSYKGLDMEVKYATFCERNYTEPQGRIQVHGIGIYISGNNQECFTLITAPENFTISVYFISVSVGYGHSDVFLEVFDGDNLGANKLLRITTEFDDNTPVFSTGRYLLLHNHASVDDVLLFDLNYVTTDKGQGCGGKLSNLIGQITSPMYPDTYRKTKTCEWELETPVGTTLHLHFKVFDLGRLCDQNYVQLVNRKGIIISSYCLETPADFVSTDNYVKIVSKTNKNNRGTGWVAMFAGTY